MHPMKSELVGFLLGDFTHLVICYIAIENTTFIDFIVDLPIQNGDFL
jgi:hypothetical protein